MSFKLINSNRFLLKGTNNRFLHLATVHEGTREYMCFADTLTTNIYIEEITGGLLTYIEEDKKVEEINNFLTRKRILEMSRPLIEDKKWFKKK